MAIANKKGVLSAESFDARWHLGEGILDSLSLAKC